MFEIINYSIAEASLNYYCMNKESGGSEIMFIVNKPPGSQL